MNELLAKLWNQRATPLKTEQFVWKSEFSVKLKLSWNFEKRRRLDTFRDLILYEKSIQRLAGRWQSFRSFWWSYRRLSWSKIKGQSLWKQKNFWIFRQISRTKSLFRRRKMESLNSKITSNDVKICTEHSGYLQDAIPTLCQVSTGFTVAWTLTKSHWTLPNRLRLEHEKWTFRRLSRSTMTWQFCRNSQWNLAILREISSHTIFALS